MLLKFFKKPLPSVLLAVVIIGVAAWITSLFLGGGNVANFSSYRMPLYGLLVSLLPAGSIWPNLLALLIIIINGFLLIQLNTKYILIKNRTHLPALFYILLCSGFIPLQTVNPAIFSAFFAILVLNSLFSTLSGNPLDGLFKAGFYTALGTLFYLPTVVLFLLILVAIVVLNVSGIRSWLAAIVGFATPVLLTSFYYYYFKGEFQLTQIILDAIADGAPLDFFDYGVPSLVWLSFGLFLLLISGLFVVSNMPTQKINVRKYYGIFLLMILFVGAATTILPFASAESVFLFAIPFSYLLSNYFTFARSRFFPEVLFSILLLLVVIIQFFAK